MDEWIGVIVPIALGLLLIGVGTPLMRRQVPRNRWYGVRFPSTLADDAVWYPVNERGGRYLVVLGAALTFVGLLGLVFTGNATTQRDLVILAFAILASGLGFTVWSCVELARELRHGQRLRNGSSRQRRPQ